MDFKVSTFKSLKNFSSFDWSAQNCSYWLGQILDRASSLDADVTMKVETGLPFFLENNPAVICDQVLWLIKNSGLNFQVKETPFSLDINLKKNFVKVWNQSTVNPVLNQCTSHFSQHVKSEEKTSPQSTEVPDSLHKVETLKANLDEALREKNDACEDLFQTDQAHRKLCKENKELIKKHEQVCSELKLLKVEKDTLAKETSSLSVALKANKKDLEQIVRSFETERKSFEKELENLIEFKKEKDAELKQIKKAEKKSRQKAKKEAKESTDRVHSEDQNLKEIPLDKISSEDMTESTLANICNSAASEYHLQSDAFAKPENSTKPNSSESYTFKSEDPRFLDFPENFQDWSEDQKKDAYDNYFKLYLQKSLKIY